MRKSQTPNKCQHHLWSDRSESPSRCSGRQGLRTSLFVRSCKRWTVSSLGLGTKQAPAPLGGISLQGTPCARLQSPSPTVASSPECRRGRHRREASGIKEKVPVFTGNIPEQLSPAAKSWLIAVCHSVIIILIRVGKYFIKRLRILAVREPFASRPGGCPPLPGRVGKQRAPWC